jgi:ankyrin repeat protein
MSHKFNKFNRPLPKHHSPLSFAVKSGKLDEVRALIDAKASVNMVNCVGLTAIMYSQDLEITKLLVQARADVVTPTEYRTVLNMACMTRKLDIIQYLVSQGADVNLPDRYGRTPLMSVFAVSKEHPATRNAELPAIVDFLLSAGARVDAVDQYGDSALIVAARYKGDDRNAHIAAMKMQVDVGGVALVNLQNIAKATALCFVESVSMAKVLVSAGADVNLCLKGEQSPLSRACLANNPSLVEFLIKSGANIQDVNDTDNDLQDVIFRVVNNRYIGVLLQLVDAKANVNVGSGPSSLTPLMHAVEKNMLTEIAVLIHGGANARSYQHGMSTLMLACKKDDANPRTIKMLLDAGAIEDLDKRNYKTFETAYDMAIENDVSQSVIDVLVAAGCNTTGTYFGNRYR